VTRELKLALIVGFALVLVVTVLISDHLSHARQAELAGNVPAEPIKVAEPPSIAFSNNDPAPATPAPSATPAPGPSTTLASNTPAPGSLGLADPAGPATIPANDPPFVMNQGRSSATGSGDSALDRAVNDLGGTIHDGKIFVGPQPPLMKPVKEPIGSGINADPLPPARPLTSKPTTTQPSVTAAPDRIHTVVPGDSAFKIAKDYYGDGKVWRKLIKYNHMDEEAQLKVGAKLNIPSSEVLLGKKSTAVANVSPTTIPAPTTLKNTGTVTVLTGNHTAAAKTHSYTVKKGDTLAQIAKQELGSSRRATDILKLNKDTIHDPDNIPLGAVLALPSA
jgi:LysM repeat protein